MTGNLFRRASARAGLIATALLLGCSHEIESPTLASKAVQPDLVCVEQLTTEVTLSGDGFTPMPIKTLDATELRLPHIALNRKQYLDGAAASGKADIPDDPVAPAKSLVHWASEQRMSFEVTPDLALVPGLVESVSFVDDATLTAVVPKNEPAHVYDLIVVNPDGSVGLLTDAFTVQAVPPPTIATIVPSSIVNAMGQQVKVTGKNFAGSKLSLACVDAIGNALAAPPVTFSAEICDAAQACSQTATINGGTLPAGSIGVLRATNADGSFFDFSAIGVTNASLNLPGTHVGTSLNVGRRALIASAGNATPSARFIYAIGGDGGAAMANAPFNSTEVASVDLFGNMGAWKLQPASTLGSPRSFAASATLGRYIYVAGAPLLSVAGYDIYRTPVVNGTSGGEVLIASLGTGTLKYTDDGSAAPGTQTPLPLGGTGKLGSDARNGNRPQLRGRSLRVRSRDPWEILFLRAARAQPGQSSANLVRVFAGDDPAQWSPDRGRILDDRRAGVVDRPLAAQRLDRGQQFRRDPLGGNLQLGYRFMI